MLLSGLLTLSELQSDFLYFTFGQDKTYNGKVVNLCLSHTASFYAAAS